MLFPGHAIFQTKPKGCLNHCNVNSRPYLLLNIYYSTLPRGHAHIFQIFHNQLAWKWNGIDTVVLLLLYWLDLTPWGLWRFVVVVAAARRPSPANAGSLLSSSLTLLIFSLVQSCWVCASRLFMAWLYYKSCPIRQLLLELQSALFRVGWSN